MKRPSTGYELIESNLTTKTCNGDDPFRVPGDQPDTEYMPIDWSYG